MGVLIKIAIASAIGLICMQSSAMELQPTDSLTVEGPIEVRLHYSAMPRLIYDESRVSISRNGHHVTITATRPSTIDIRTNYLKGLTLQERQLLVRLEGSERINLGRVVAPEIRVALLERARFDSDYIVANYLQITLSGQGKASLLDVVADLFELNLNDHSDIDVAGQTRQQDIELSDYSHYDGGELRSENARVALNGYAAAFIQADNQPIVSATPYTSLSAR
ncbi:MAG: hypothetical protein ACI82A_000887 [Candidatus Azotimanducaceae bacterium]|jgi:hypothetical protein